MTREQFKGFVNSYLQTAAWVTADSNECDQFTRQAKKYAAEDCQLFIDKVNEVFETEQAERLLKTLGNDVTYLAAHDFFLTRNRHGAGFWEKENIYGEENAEKLTKICHEIGGADVFHVRGPKSKLTF